VTPIGPVLVTGGAGFIGSHLVDRLRADGHEVTVLDDFSTGRRANLAERAGDAAVRIVDGSILDPKVVGELVARHPLVFHLAAAVGVRNILSDPIRSMLTNVRGTEHVLDAASRSGSRILLASTSEIYGKNPAVPFTEAADRVLGPTSVHRWSYSTGKALDEHLALAYAERGLRVSIVRYFNSYGPRLDERGYGSVVARFITQALAGKPLTVHGDGEQTRCFTYVTDTVDGTLRAGTQDAALGRVFNIGIDREITLRDLAQLIVRLTGSVSPIELVPYETAYPAGFEDTRRRVPDIARARAELGFAPAVTLEDGLARTIEWSRANAGTAVAR
jgi:UDP-glucose 4-epimerase